MIKFGYLDKKYVDNHLIDDFLDKEVKVSEFASLLYPVKGDSYVISDGAENEQKQYYALINYSNIDKQVNTLIFDGTGLRPCIKYDSLDEFDVCYREDNNMIVEYGFYPSKMVNRGLQETLSENFTCGNLKKTNHQYIIDQKKDKGSNMKFDIFDEYIYENHLFIRINISEYISPSYHYGNIDKELLDFYKKHYQYIWIEIEPVRWYVRSTEKLLISEKILLKNPQNIDVHDFLTKYFSYNIRHEEIKRELKKIEESEYSGSELLDLDMEPQIIGKKAFKHSLKLTNVILPWDIKEIQTQAFYQCFDLNLKIRSSFFDLNDNIYAAFNTLKSLYVYDRYIDLKGDIDYELEKIRKQEYEDIIYKLLPNIYDHTRNKFYRENILENRDLLESSLLEFFSKKKTSIIQFLAITLQIPYTEAISKLENFYNKVKENQDCVWKETIDVQKLSKVLENNNINNKMDLCSLHFDKDFDESKVGIISGMPIYYYRNHLNKSIKTILHNVQVEYYELNLGANFIEINIDEMGYYQNDNNYSLRDLQIKFRSSLFDIIGSKFDNFKAFKSVKIYGMEISLEGCILDNVNKMKILEIKDIVNYFNKTYSERIHNPEEFAKAIIYNRNNYNRYGANSKLKIEMSNIKLYLLGHLAIYYDISLDEAFDRLESFYDPNKKVEINTNLVERKELPKGESRYITIIADDTFMHFDYQYRDITGPINISVKENSSLKRIGASAFENNYFLNSAIFPNTIRMIGIDAFKGCNNLKLQIGTSFFQIDTVVTDKNYNVSVLPMNMAFKRTFEVSKLSMFDHVFKEISMAEFNEARHDEMLSLMNFLLRGSRHSYLLHFPDVLDDRNLSMYQNSYEPYGSVLEQILNAVADYMLTTNRNTWNKTKDEILTHLDEKTKEFYDLFKHYGKPNYDEIDKEENKPRVKHLISDSVRKKEAVKLPSKEEMLEKVINVEKPSITEVTVTSILDYGKVLDGFMIYVSNVFSEIMNNKFSYDASVNELKDKIKKYGNNFRNIKIDADLINLLSEFAITNDGVLRKEIDDLTGLTKIILEYVKQVQKYRDYLVEYLNNHNDLTKLMISNINEKLDSFEQMIKNALHEYERINSVIEVDFKACNNFSLMHNSSLPSLIIETNTKLSLKERRENIGIMRQVNSMLTDSIYDKDIKKLTKK